MNLGQEEDIPQRYGKISELPFKLGALSALEVPVEGGTAYMSISATG